jgi:hypothetical protein
MGPNHDYLGVKYSELIPVLTKAIQELNKKVVTLQDENGKLKAAVAAGEARDAKLAELSEQIHQLQQMTGVSKTTSGAKSAIR